MPSEHWLGVSLHPPYSKGSCAFDGLRFSFAGLANELALGQVCPALIEDRASCMKVVALSDCITIESIATIRE